MENKDISIIIKTFEREEALRTLLKSISASYYKGCVILIADDSKESYKDQILNEFVDLPIEYYVLPFDAGLSAGRNYLLEKVKTKYFVLCDDDFCFDKRTNLDEAKKILENNNIDILSGILYNFYTINHSIGKGISFLQRLFDYGMPQTYVGTFKIDTGNKIKTEIKTKSFKKFIKTDIVHNFFIAKTESVRKIDGWDEELKLNEHEAFFLKVKRKGLNIGHSTSWGIRHYPQLSTNYSKYRSRNFGNKMLEKYNLKEWIDYVDNGMIFEKYLDENNNYVFNRKYQKNIKGILRKVFYSITKYNK